MTTSLLSSPQSAGNVQQGGNPPYAVLPSSPQFAEAFPDVRVRGLILDIATSHPRTNLWELWRELHGRWRGCTRAAIAEIPEISAYRNFNRRIGLNPDRTPPSTQGLIQRFMAADTLKPMPPLPALVNLINIIAVRTLVPLGAFDCAALVGQVTIDFAQDGERMVPIGAFSPIDVPAGAVVLRDEEKILSQFGSRDSDSQKISDQTRRLMLLACQVPGTSDTAIDGALDQAVDALVGGFDASPHYSLRS